MNYWNQIGVPQKGWELDDVVDVRENGEEEWEANYETCMMCGKEKIRFVHLVSHPEIIDQFRVGCVCAEKMTEDYTNPKLREKALLNRANRRANWLRREWRLSKSGNFFLNVNNSNIVIYRDKKTQKFKVKIDEVFGRRIFDTLAKAKVAAFNGLEFLKQRGDW